MRSVVTRLLPFLALVFGSSSSLDAKTSEESYFEIHFYFAGLIAFVPTIEQPTLERPSKSAVVALFPDTDYNPHNSSVTEWGPGAKEEMRLSLPPHFPALRIYGAETTTYLEKLVSPGAPISLAGMDIELDFPEEEEITSLLGGLATPLTFEKFRTNQSNVAIPRETAKVDARFLTTRVNYWKEQVPELNTRLKMNEGHVSAKVISCKTGLLAPEPAQYLFRYDGATDPMHEHHCEAPIGGKTTALSELVLWKVKRNPLDGLTINLKTRGSSTSQVYPIVILPNGKNVVIIEVVNSTDGREYHPGPSLNSLTPSCEDGHLESFRVFYWLTQKPSFYWYWRMRDPPPYYYPCVVDTATAGGTRCPMIQLESP